MQFAIVCHDRPGALPLRMENRPAHREYLAANVDKLKLGGPFLDASGEMCGSMLVVDVADMAAAEAFAKGDPYSKAGLFVSVTIKAFNGVIGSWVA